MTQNPYTHKTKSKAKEQRFYCRSSSQSEAFNTERTLTPHCKFKTAPSTGLSGIRCLMSITLHPCIEARYNFNWQRNLTNTVIICPTSHFKTLTHYKHL